MFSDMFVVKLLLHVFPFVQLIAFELAMWFLYKLFA